MDIAHEAAAMPDPSRPYTYNSKNVAGILRGFGLTTGDDRRGTHVECDPKDLAGVLRQYGRWDDEKNEPLWGGCGVGGDGGAGGVW
jgi:hypothetical protein